MNKTSKSDQLYRLLLERISRLSDGDNFPTLREIMREYRVSQFTAAPALKRLQEKGLIASHVGRGSVVTRAAGRRHGATILYPAPRLALVFHSGDGGSDDRRSGRAGIPL